MGLKEIKIAVGETTTTRLITERVEKVEELKRLMGDSGYFYGGVIQKNQDQSGQAYFGNGPNHELFEETIITEVSITGVLGSDFHVHLAQVNASPRESDLIDSVLFLDDPGKREDRITPDEQSPNTRHRRLAVVNSLVSALDPQVCQDEVDIGWLGLGHHEIEYVFLPKIPLLKKMP